MAAATGGAVDLQRSALHTQLCAATMRSAVDSGGPQCSQHQRTLGAGNGFLRALRHVRNSAATCSTSASSTPESFESPSSRAAASIKAARSIAPRAARAGSTRRTAGAVQSVGAGCSLLRYALLERSLTVPRVHVACRETPLRPLCRSGPIEPQKLPDVTRKF